jgi:hypothetical protein
MRNNLKGLITRGLKVAGPQAKIEKLRNNTEWDHVLD